MVTTVQTYIEKHGLLTDNKPVIVGFSGGADSVALLYILVRLGYACIAAHCNFHLRGEESDRDQRFAGEMAESLRIPFFTTDFRTTDYASQHHLSTEMAARELRYQWFETLRAQHQAQAIAVAHHLDDNAETLLLNLVRGTGIKGLRGMLPRQGHIIRPLLGLTRDQILRWISRENLSYVTDQTNLSDAYRRNFIRLQIIPMLEQLNPSVKQSINRTAGHLADTELIYNSVIAQAREQVWEQEGKLSIPLLKTFPAPTTVLYELLKPYGFNRIISQQVYEALDRESGKEFYSPAYQLTKDREHLLLSRKEKKEEQIYLLEENSRWETPIELSYSKTVITTTFRIEKDRHIACFDYNKLSFPLILRTWQPGDWFIPFGMTGRKKLSDYFSDHKFSRPDKERTWILCSGKDIIWIVGERTDNRFRITDTTDCVLTVKISDEKR